MIFDLLIYYILFFTYLFLSFLNGQTALSAQLAVLVHDAVNAPLLHGLTVVNVLRGEGSIWPEKYLYQQKKHADSNY